MGGGFRYSDDNKRYHTLNYHNRQVYGGRVFKAAINAGFSCPNIDGSKGRGGCIYCGGGSGYFSHGGLSVSEQIERERSRIHEKYPEAKITAYFQANSNTYAPAGYLRRLFEEAISCVLCGIAAATRADCIDGEKARLLAELPVPVTVELGLQTVHDSTARAINRCHSFAEFLEGYSLLKRFGVRVCVHIINGLPGEDEGMMLETARILGRLRPEGVKIHSLHVIEGTLLHEMFERGEYTPIGKQEYINIAVRQLELLPPETVIERLTGDGDKKTLTAPLWSADKISVLGGIDKRMEQLDTVQGRYFTEE